MTAGNGQNPFKVPPSGWSSILPSCTNIFKRFKEDIMDKIFKDRQGNLYYQITKEDGSKLVFKLVTPSK